MNPDEIKQATEAVKSAGELARAADPLAKMALQTFMTTVKMAPQMLEPALAMVPQPMQNQLRAAISAKKPSRKKKSGARMQTTRTKAPMPWGWIALGGVGVVGLAAALRASRKRG